MHEQTLLPLNVNSPDEEVHFFQPFECFDGLIEYKIRYDSPSKICILSRKETFDRRADGLLMVFRTPRLFGTRFEHFRHPHNLSTFTLKPFTTECYWKYRLDGLVSSTHSTGRCMRTEFDDRPDRKVACEVILGQEEHGVENVRVVVSFDSQLAPLEYSGVLSSSQDWPETMQPHIREVSKHLEIRMVVLHLLFMFIQMRTSSLEGGL